MSLIKIGAKVRITARGATKDAPAGTTGVVVGGTAWTNTPKDPGDRVVKLDTTGERLVWEGYYLEVIG